MEISSPPVFFEDRKQWRDWLLDHHSSSQEIWIRYFKKQSGKKSMVYREALEEALCFGWIDGIVKSENENSYVQRFTPRRPNGNWSEVNIKLALKLLDEGKMHTSGLVFKYRWIPAEKPGANAFTTLTGIENWEDLLKQHPEALKYYESLAPSHRKQYYGWIHSAKRPETRQKRMAEAIATLEKGQKLGMK
jgi:uncharacterized protein YdeI (YjbR/CyaY-like superfamily)